MNVKKINIDSCLKHLLMFCFLYLGQWSVINYAKYARFSTLVLLLEFGIGVGVFAYAFCVKGKKISFSTLGVGGVCITNYIITMVINADWRKGYVLLTMNIISAIFFTALCKRREFYRIYTNCIAMIMIVAMIATYLVLPFAASYLSIVTNGNANYYDMAIAYPIIHAEAYRLNAIWTEPGIAAVYIMFALFFELLILNTRKLVCLILVLAMLCTRSSTGYVLLLMVLGTYILKQILEKKMLMVLIWGCGAGALALLALYVVVPDMMTELLNKYNPNSINFIGRFAPIIYNLDMWRTSPLFGGGFQEGYFRVNYKIYRGVLFANTSTTTLLLQQFGFLLPVLSIVASWKISSTGKNSKLITVLMTIILLLGVNFENQTLDTVYTIILFSALMPLEGIENDENIIIKHDAYK